MKPVKIPKETRDALISEIQEYFEKERGETIGNLAADSLLEFFTARLGPHLYNRALGDCRQLVGQHMVSLEDDIYALEQKTSSSR